MANPIDRAYLDIDGTNVACDSIDIEPEDDTDFVTAMTKDNEPIGTKSGNRRYNVTCKVTMTDDEEVDFEALWEEKTNVKVNVEFEGGTYWTFGKGVIAKSGIAAAHGDKTTRNLDLKCWQRVIS